MSCKVIIITDVHACDLLLEFFFLSREKTIIILFYSMMVGIFLNIFCRTRACKHFYKLSTSTSHQDFLKKFISYSPKLTITPLITDFTSCLAIFFLKSCPIFSIVALALGISIIFFALLVMFLRSIWNNKWAQCKQWWQKNSRMPP